MKAKQPFNLYRSSFLYKFRAACDNFKDKYIEENKIKSRTEAHAALAKQLLLSDSLLDKYLCGQKEPDEDKIVLFTKVLNLHDEFLIDDSPGGHGMIERIRREFLKLDPLPCYKISIFYQYYSLIYDNTWTFIVNYSILNNLGKSKLKQFVFENTTTLESVLNHLDELMLLYSARNLKDRLLNDFVQDEQLTKKSDEYNSDESYKRKKWDVLKNQLIELRWFDLERFLRQMKYIVDLDSEDWNLIIAFLLLSDKISSISSERQKKVLDYSESLIRSETYNEDYKIIISQLG